MLKYLGFVSVMYDVNHSFPACDAEYLKHKARRAEAARLAAAAKPGRAAQFGQAVQAAMAGLATLIRSQIVSRDERVLKQNISRLARLSPHLLDDIGLLPKDADFVAPSLHQAPVATVQPQRVPARKAATPARARRQLAGSHLAATA